MVGVKLPTQNGEAIHIWLLHALSQCDQIGQIFAQWEIVFLEQFFFEKLQK
jgi:hypothetical protein